MIGAATEKARLPRFSFVLGIESCWEVDDRTVDDSHCCEVQCAKMIAEIAAELESNLHDDIVAAKYISVMADGATDKGILENEAVCVRSLNEEGVCENLYLALIEMDNALAEGVLATINSAFETVLIENISDKLIAFTAEGASVNMGSKNGVQARLRQHTLHLIDMWYMPHKLELSVSDACGGSLMFAEHWVLCSMTRKARSNIIWQFIATWSILQQPAQAHYVI